MAERQRLIINAKGEEKIIYPQEVITPEKKPHVVDEEAILEHLSEARRLAKEMSVGQREATVEIKAQYPDQPAQCNPSL